MARSARGCSPTPRPPPAAPPAAARASPPRCWRCGRAGSARTSRCGGAPLRPPPLPPPPPQKQPAASSSATLVPPAQPTSGEIRCHSAVLAAQGEFWEALLFGPLARRDAERPRRGYRTTFTLLHVLRCVLLTCALRCAAPFHRPDRIYEMGEISPETLSPVVDFSYTGEIPETLSGPAALAALQRVAHRFLMPPLLEACWVRAAGTVAPGDEGVFLLHDAAEEVGHDKTAKMARRFSCTSLHVCCLPQD